MYVDNICLEFQMEIGQRHVVSYLHREGMKLPAIVLSQRQSTTKMHSTKTE
jgi:hypothetical protein